MSPRDLEITAFFQGLSLKELVQHLAVMIAAVARDGVLSYGKDPKEALDTTFAWLGAAIEGALEGLRPDYEARCETDLFAASVSEGIENIDDL